MKKKILFLTVASKKNGIGHLSRSLKLIKNLKKKDYSFYLVGLKKNYKNYFNKSLFKKIIFSNDINPFNQKTLRTIISLKPDLCIVDVPKANIRFEKKLYDNKIKFLVYDNLLRKKIYADFLVNLNPRISKKNYKRKIFKNRCKLLLGINYFQYKFKNKINIKKFSKIENIFLFFGGGYINYRLLENVLKNISLSDLVKKNINFVSKQKISHQNKIKLKKKYNLKINFFHNLNTLDKLIKKSDLAIITSGTVAFEVLPFNIPMLLISVAKNQVDMAKTWSKLGAGLYIGNHSSKFFSKKISKSIKDILKENLRFRMYYSQRNIYRNYKNKLIEFFKNFK